MSKRKRGSRGRLVARLRDGKYCTSDAMPTSARSPLDRTRISILSGPEQDSVTLSSNWSSSYSAEFFVKLLPDFEQLVYPLNPILTSTEIRDSIANMHGSLEDTALVHAFGATTISLTKPSWILDGQDLASLMVSLVQFSIRAHRQVETDKNSHGSSLLSKLPVSVKRIMTCIWIQIPMISIRRFDRSFAALREAISMIEMLDIHQYGDSDTQLDSREVARRQRMYWEAFIHERSLFIISGYPCIMQPLRTGLPFADQTVPSFITVGFDRLILLFETMDESFVEYWSAQFRQRKACSITAQWVDSKQTELDQHEVDTTEAERKLEAGGHGSLNELQHTDLFITRLWLRTLIWQLGLSNGLLHSTPPNDVHEGLSLNFPANYVSAQLRVLVCRLHNLSSIIFHGSGILQKLFEITSTAADVLSLPCSDKQQTEASEYLEDLLFLVRLLFTFDRTQRHQRDYLQEKLDALQRVFPMVDFGDLMRRN
ncbi:hypothetical protein O9K51_10991 [Purpureocillium lavendulum]|uniref:Transcription factor domain-containing protein n=1 Tax=Purpureocillium lavendulum TaxID=1247861 RepID=A0AB34FBF1_9HYPO|nr:hypothetical protein O9K51_10991 [Purpureocillium lavendulum]